MRTLPNPCTIILFAMPFILLLACGKPQEQQADNEDSINKLAFESFKIADSLQLIWAHSPADITGDGVMDLVFVNNNGHGGTLEYLEGSLEPGNWDRHLIAAEAPGRGTFAQGDLECADIDADGDLDIIAINHVGEWDKSDDVSTLYWYENPGWVSHPIGEVPEFVKDVGLEDFNKDGKMDLVALTFETNTLTVFLQNSADTWQVALQHQNFNNLHEGMGTGQGFSVRTARR